MDEQKALRVMRDLVDEGQLTDPDSARGKLLQVAAHLFRNKGYERTTVRDLAGAVGIQSGSIFHHFKSKDEILRAVMEETIRYNTALMRAALAGPGKSGLRAVLERLDVAWVNEDRLRRVDSAQHAFADVDTPDDLARCRQWTGGDKA